jgi:hypothetical protein
MTQPAPRSEKAGSNRAFGVTFAVVFAILSLWPLVHGRLPRWWLLIPAAAFLLVALAKPDLLALPNALWLRFSLLLNRIMSPMIMGLLFFLVATPTGWAMRLARRNLLSLNKPAKKSYWIERSPPGPATGSLRNQF